jgi:hypothetical protein
LKGIDGMNYNNLIEGLIELNKQCRIHIKESDRYSVSPLFYAIEFCTVAVNIGRGVGKTTFIKNHAKKGDLVMVINSIAKRIQYGKNIEFDIITLDELDKVRGRRYQNIYIDEPAAVFEGDFEKKINAYQLLIDPYKDQTFVLLGEQV